MDPNEVEHEKAIAAVRAVFERYEKLAALRPEDHRDFDRAVMASLELIDASPSGKVVYEMTIMKDFSNLNNIMHGGAAALVFDMATTTALCPLARPGSWEFMAGVSRSLNVSYLKSVPIGTRVRITSTVMAVGKNMAMVRGEMTSLDGKTTYCTAEHHKVNTPAVADHLKMRIPWDDEFEKQWGKAAPGKSKI